MQETQVQSLGQEDPLEKDMATHSNILLYIYIYIILFTYLWLHWVLAALRAFSSCGEWGLLYSCGARASRCSGSSRSGAQPQ